MKSEFVFLDVEGTACGLNTLMGLQFLHEAVHLSSTRVCKFFETLSAGMCKHLEAERREHKTCGGKAACKTCLEVAVGQKNGRLVSYMRSNRRGT